MAASVANAAVVTPNDKKNFFFCFFFRVHFLEIFILANEGIIYKRFRSSLHLPISW